MCVCVRHDGGWCGCVCLCVCLLRVWLRPVCLSAWLYGGWVGVWLGVGLCMMPYVCAVACVRDMLFGYWCVCVVGRVCCLDWWCAGVLMCAFVIVVSVCCWPVCMLVGLCMCV